MRPSAIPSQNKFRLPLLAATVACGSLLSVGCAEDTLTSVSTITNEFKQNTAAKIDVLWVVDNSESMAAEQAGIGASFQAFITNLIDSGVDYHIGVVSTDISGGGRLFAGTSGVAYIDSSTNDPAGIFLENVRVGITGSRVERAFESAALALGKGRGWNPGDPINTPNNGFIRDDAALFIIMVSDENDKSFGPSSYYKRLFEGYKGPGNESRISVSAIVGPPSGTCANALEAGERYITLAQDTGGIWTSICDDFAESLRELSITAAGLKSIFRLATIPNAGSTLRCTEGGPSYADRFCVTVDGEGWPERGANGNTVLWSYEPQENAIVFDARTIPPPEARITVEYLEARGGN